jgi:very-short-patch-repair endonuclease
LYRILTFTRSGAVSAAEFRLHRGLRAAGSTGWVANARIEVQGVPITSADVLFEVERVIVEVDGWRAHGAQDAFGADRRRQNALQAAGYRVVRFTWWDLTERPDGVIAEIRQALRQRGRP